MSIGALDAVHATYVHGRRCRVLTKMLAGLISPKSRLLDVGCGDGRIAEAIGQMGSSTVVGVDTLVRQDCRIRAARFDGKTLPFRDRTFDTVLFVDVLHHADDPVALLHEGARVAHHSVVIKDHLCDAVFARQTLAFMDRVGNARHGVSSPGHYFSRQQWKSAFATARLNVADCTTDVPLYPFWASWLFGRSLHFVAALRVV